ncbi:MAG: Phosphoribosyl-AMP cyclohydrolase, partial [uncultured Nocardioidaceae bacterium]
ERPGRRGRRTAQAGRRRARRRRRAAARHPRGAHGRVDGRRGAAPDADDRADHLLEPVTPGVLGQGRDLRPPPVGHRRPARLRRGHAAGPRRPGGTGLPHRGAELLRRRRPERPARPPGAARM